MAASNYQNINVSREIRISADWEQATSQIWWQDLDDDPSDTETWHSTPYQVADAGHNQNEALRLVDDWLGTESPAC